MGKKNQQANKKPQQKKREKKQETTALQSTDSQDKQVALSFEDARIKAKQERSTRIDEAVDKAIGVMADILGDEKIDRVSKLYPAKMVIDLYTTKERLSIEEEKLKLDQQKVALEKAKLSVPGGPLFIINNGEVNQNKTVVQATPQSQESQDELQKRKHAQAKLLEEVSGVPQFITEETIKKEDS